MTSPHTESFMFELGLSEFGVVSTLSIGGVACNTEISAFAVCFDIQCALIQSLLQIANARVVREIQCKRFSSERILFGFLHPDGKTILFEHDLKMVFFTCNHCGESLKKATVAKHYSFNKCKFNFSEK